MTNQIMWRTPACGWIGLLIALVAAGNLPGQPAPQNPTQPQRIRGIILSVAADRKSFSIVDRSGRTVAVNVGATTTYEANGGEVTFRDVLKFGADVRIFLAADGSAAQVIARGMARGVDPEQLQPFMGVTDAEWAVIKPKIDRVIAAQRAVEGGNGNSGNNQDNGNGNGQLIRSPVREMQRSLASGFFDQFSSDKLNANLAALREAKAKARADLLAAQKELIEVVTVRQEVLLVVAGILE